MHKKYQQVITLTHGKKSAVAKKGNTKEREIAAKEAKFDSKAAAVTEEAKKHQV